MKAPILPSMFKCQVSAQSPAKKDLSSRKEAFALASVGSATVPTGRGGHGGSPYGPKHLEFHTRFNQLKLPLLNLKLPQAGARPTN